MSERWSEERRATWRRQLFDGIVHAPDEPTQRYILARALAEADRELKHHQGEPRRQWLQGLIARAMAHASELKKIEGTGGQLGAYWTGYEIALQDISMAVLLDLFMANANAPGGFLVTPDEPVEGRL